MTKSSLQTFSNNLRKLKKHMKTSRSLEANVRIKFPRQKGYDE